MCYVREASTSRRANRITWTIPLPTAMGLDGAAMPPAATEREKGEGQSSRNAKQKFRRVAVTGFNGLPQVYIYIYLVYIYTILAECWLRVIACCVSL